MRATKDDNENLLEKYITMHPYSCTERSTHSSAQSLAQRVATRTQRLLGEGEALSGKRDSKVQDTYRGHLLCMPFVRHSSLSAYPSISASAYF